MPPPAEASVAYDAAFGRGIRPDPLLSVAEWADAHRVLSAKAAAEPGRWRTARTPYLRKILEALSATSPYERVVVRKGSQVGATEAGNCWIGYVIDQAPGPMLAVSPTVELAKRASKQRIDPMIEDTPRLRAHVKERRERDSGNTVLAKEYPGGVLVLTGANSAVGLRSMPARYLFLDEIDAYPQSADEEGDPIWLAMRATRTFQRKKILEVSTPLVRGLSRIDREIENVDQQWHFHVPCPDCGHAQRLVWPQLHWEAGKPETATYACVACGSAIAEHHKTWMLEHGDWVAAWNRGERSIGFDGLSALYSPVGWFSWAEAVDMYEKAEREKDKVLLRVFTNTVLGESSEEHHETPDWRRLYERRESYPTGIVPTGGLFLTAGTDVQADRLETEIVAWGRGGESWSVDSLVIDGDPTRPEIWREWEQRVLGTEWPRADGGSMVIRVACVDSGFATQHVYAQVRRHPQPAWGQGGASAKQPRTVAATKGIDRAPALVAGTIKADAGQGKFSLRVWSVGTSQAKSELYHRLKLERPTAEEQARGVTYPPGYCHFPEYGETFFQQLTAEQYVIRVVKGFPRGAWELPGGKRNEALDCRVYARAAAAIYGIDRFTDAQWNVLSAVYQPPPEPPPIDPPSSRHDPQGESPSPSTGRRKVHRSGWMAR